MYITATVISCVNRLIKRRNKQKPSITYAIDPVVKILTSTSAIFTAYPIIVAESGFFFFFSSLKKFKQLFHKKAGVVSRLIIWAHI